jgi:hypothetical protein
MQYQFMWAQIIAVAVASAVLAFALIIGKQYPIWETWYFIPVWDEFARGGPWLRSLFADRWGHVHAVPNAINLFVGYISGYSMKVDIVLTWLAALSAFVLMLRRVSDRTILIVAIAAGLFSIRNMEVWVSSWNLAWTLSLLWAVSIGVVISGRLTLARMGAAIAISVLAVLTLGVGVAIIASPIVVLAWRALRETPARWTLLAWSVWMAGLLFLFRSIREGGPGVSRLLSADWTAFLGQASFPLLEAPSLMVGAALVLALCGLVASNMKLPDDPIFRFWLYLASCVLVFLVLLSVARPAPRSRYLLFLFLLPACIAVLLGRISSANERWRPVYYGAVSIWLAVAGYQSCAFAQVVWGWYGATARVEELARTNPDALIAKDFLGIAASDEALVARGLETMKRLRVNIFSR